MNTPSRLDGSSRGRVRAVVFDLMFTLIQPEYRRFPGGRGRMGWIAELLGLDEADLMRRWRQFEPVLEAGAATSGQSTHGAPERPELTWVRALAEECGVPLEDDVGAAIEAGWDLPYRQALMNPSGEALATLAALRERGLRLGLLSDTHGLEVRAWPRSPLSQLFDAACFSHEIGVMKPHPESYAAVLHALQAPAAQAAFVGDGGSDELAGARRAGFGLVVFAKGTWSGWSREQLAARTPHVDATIRSLGELPALLVA